MPTNTLNLVLLADGQVAPLAFNVQRMVNAGYVGRDQAAVQAHIDEMLREGIPAPASVPMLFPMPADNVTTADRIEVFGEQTSGEVEFVLLLAGGEMYVGVGSDHTDRALERDDLIKSKQLCKNVISREVWRYRDVQAHWDELVLQSWVRPPGVAHEQLYQKAVLGSILSAEELVKLVKSRTRHGSSDGLVIYSGTIPVVSGHLIYGDTFRAELLDPRSGKSLSCAYRVEKLDYLQS